VFEGGGEIGDAVKASLGRGREDAGEVQSRDDIQKKSSGQQLQPIRVHKEVAPRVLGPTESPSLDSVRKERRKRETKG